MWMIPGSVKIYLYAQPADLRNYAEYRIMWSASLALAADRPHSDLSAQSSTHLLGIIRGSPGTQEGGPGLCSARPSSDEARCDPARVASF